MIALVEGAVPKTPNNRSEHPAGGGPWFF
jgi:hypothetical protein